MGKALGALRAPTRRGGYLGAPFVEIGEGRIRARNEDG
jgi:hypothetical protein